MIQNSSGNISKTNKLVKLEPMQSSADGWQAVKITDLTSKYQNLRQIR